MGLFICSFIRLHANQLIRNTIVLFVSELTGTSHILFEDMTRKTITLDVKYFFTICTVVNRERSLSSYNIGQL